MSHSQSVYFQKQCINFHIFDSQDTLKYMPWPKYLYLKSPCFYVFSTNPFMYYYSLSTWIKFFLNFALSQCSFKMPRTSILQHLNSNKCSLICAPTYELGTLFCLYTQCMSLCLLLLSLLLLVYKFISLTTHYLLSSETAHIAKPQNYTKVALN